MATYTAQTRTLTARPRSERLRQTVGSGMAVGGGIGSAFGSYLPASENGNGYDVNHKTSFVQNIRLGNPDTVVGGETVVNGIDIEFDSATGAVHIKGGLYADWVSAMGANDSSSGSGGGGLDESALWELLNGTSTPEYTGSKIISSSYLPSIALSSTYGTLPVDRGGTGATTAADALKNLIGSFSIGGNYPIYWTGSSFSQLTGTLSNNISGKVNGCTISSTVNSGTADYLTYYSGANTISDTSANKEYYIGGGIVVPEMQNGAMYGLQCGSNVFGFRTSGTPGPLILSNTGDLYFGKYEWNSNNWCNFHYVANTSSDYLCFLPVSSNKTLNVGIGTNSPSCMLDVSGGSIRVLNSNNYGVLLAGYGGNVIDGAGPSGAYAALYLNYNTSANVNLCYGGGNVGIGTNSPAFKLTVVGNIVASNTIGILQSAGSGAGISLYGNPPSGIPNFGLAFASTTNFGKFGDVQGDWATYFTMDTTWGTRRGWVFRTNNTSLNVASISSEGNFCAYGGVTALATSSSDKRLKKDIKPFNAMEIVDKLVPVKFRWNKHAQKYNCNFNNGVNYGLIAQDCDGIIDDMVFDLPDGSGYKGVRYEKLIPVLLQAIKELKLMVKELKRE